jgi:hypothetical protein
MMSKQHIGMLQGVIFGDWTLQRGPTNDIEKLKEWKNNMEKSIPNNWNDCKIFEIKEVKQNKDDRIND